VQNNKWGFDGTFFGINIMDKIIGCSNLGEYGDIINGHKWENI